MELNLIEEGFKFLVLGMTTVYIFLYVMVLILKAEYKIVSKYFPEKKKSPIKQNKPGLDISSEDEVVAVITAAIIEHNKS